jgi:superfamily I DNA/RNA helicase
MITTSAEIKILSGSADKERQLKKLMRRKKVFFMQNSGLIKLSTVHSFKGMESPTIFFILKDVDDAELVYTAITRAKTNLIILDVGNGKYSNFFESQLDKRSF